MLKTVEERLAEIQAMNIQIDYEGKTQDILDLPNNYISNFEDVIGQTLEKGRLVRLNGIKYLTIQSVTAMEHQKPSDTGMLAIYKPYTDSSTKEWIYGEYIEIGWERIYDNKIYKAIQDPNANIYSPNQVPAIWEFVEEILLPELEEEELPLDME